MVGLEEGEDKSLRAEAGRGSTSQRRWAWFENHLLMPYCDGKVSEV